MDSVNQLSYKRQSIYNPTDMSFLTANGTLQLSANDLKLLN